MYVKPMTKKQQIAEVIGNIWFAVKVALIISAPLLALATLHHH